MQKHIQTITADPSRNDGHNSEGVPGDCFRTAVACLIDKEPTSVPHFVEHGDSWWIDTQKWLSAKGWLIIYLPLPLEEDNWWLEELDSLEYVILGGPSPRGPFNHVVIGRPDLSMVHDPHPSQDGLLSVTEIFLLVPTKYY